MVKATHTETIRPEQAAVDAITAGLPTNQEEFKIGERNYTVQELDVARTFAVGDILTSQLQILFERGLLTSEAIEAMNVESWGTWLPVALALWKRSPEEFGELLALILSGEQPDDKEYIPKNMKISQLPKVILAYLRTNMWQDLVESFFQVVKEVRTGIVRIQHPQEEEKQPTS